MSTAEDLEAAHERRERCRERVAEHGEDALRAVADAHRSFVRLLDGYEDSATGTGNFGTYVEFQDRVGELVEGLDDDLPEREAFEAAGEALEQRTLRPKHFDRAREELAPVRELVDRLEEWEQARASYADVRKRVEARRDELAERVAELERLTEFGEADLDAPVERLREPIERYDEAVATAFGEFKREASARELLALVEATEAYPLVEFDQPPRELAEYVREAPAGEESVATLLEYAGYSPSKLDHYVEQPRELKRRVATNRTYLEGLDAGPLTVGWPPPPAAELRWRCREYGAVVDRFAPDRVVERLREVRALAREEEYERLRAAARTRTELDADERERVRSGAAERELAETREELERLERALEDCPAL